MELKTKIILIISALMVLLGSIFCFIDYRRITRGFKPVFMIRISDTKKSRDEYLGFGYRFKRTTGVSYKEPINNSQELKFGFWFYVWDIETQIIDKNIPDEVDNKVFKGIIIEISEDGNLIVEPSEDEDIRKSSDKISIQNIDNAIFEVGMNVIVVYTGEVMESYPAQIKVIDIQMYKPVISSESKYFINEDLVSMKIKKGTLTKKGATLILTNHSDDDLLYGQPYIIEREENNIWYNLVPIIENYGFNSIGYILEARRSREFEVQWNWLYGELEPGKYRIILNPGSNEENCFAGVEFIIEEIN